MNLLRIGAIESVPIEQAGGEIVSSGLILNLDASNSSSYPGSGTTWTDLSGNGFNATLTSGPTYSTDSGGIIVLDGNNDYCQIAHNASLSINTTTQKTIQVWFRPHALPATSVYKPVVGKLSSSFAFDGYWFGFNDLGYFRMVTNGAAVQRISTTSVQTIYANTWHFVTVILQITSTANTSKAYVNTTEIISTAHGNDTITESNPLNIGFIGTGVASQYFDGDIGSIFMYSRGLSVAEITQNFDATKARFGIA